MEEISETPKPKSSSRRSFLQKLGAVTLGLLTNVGPAGTKPPETNQTPVIPLPKSGAARFEVPANTPKVDPKSPDALIIQK